MTRRAGHIAAVKSQPRDRRTPSTPALAETADSSGCPPAGPAEVCLHLFAAHHHGTEFASSLGNTGVFFFFFF